MVRVRSGALTLSVEVGCCPPRELSLPLESIGLAVEFGALPLSGLLFGGRMQIFLSRLYGRLAYLSVGAVFGSESSCAGAGGGLRFGSCLLPRLVHLRLAQPLGFRVRAFPLGLLRDLVLGAQFGGRLGCFGVGDRLLGVRLRRAATSLCRNCPSRARESLPSTAPAVSLALPAMAAPSPRRAWLAASSF